MASLDAVFQFHAGGAGADIRRQDRAVFKIVIAVQHDRLSAEFGRVFFAQFGDAVFQFHAGGAGFRGTPNDPPFSAIKGLSLNEPPETVIPAEELEMISASSNADWPIRGCQRCWPLWTCWGYRSRI